MTQEKRDKWIERILTLAVAVLLAWGTMQSKVAVLESRVNTHDEWMKEMRVDIKELLQRVR